MTTRKGEDKARVGGIVLSDKAGNGDGEGYATFVDAVFDDMHGDFEPQYPPRRTLNSPCLV